MFKFYVIRCIYTGWYVSLNYVAASLISPWLLWWPPAESHYNIYDHSVVGYVSHAHSIVLLYSVGNKITTTNGNKSIWCVTYVLTCFKLRHLDCFRPPNGQSPLNTSCQSDDEYNPYITNWKQAKLPKCFCVWEIAVMLKHFFGTRLYRRSTWHIL